MIDECVGPQAGAIGGEAARCHGATHGSDVAAVVTGRQFPGSLQRSVNNQSRPLVSPSGSSVC